MYKYGITKYIMSEPEYDLSLRVMPYSSNPDNTGKN